MGKIIYILTLSIICFLTGTREKDMNAHFTATSLNESLKEIHFEAWFYKSEDTGPGMYSGFQNPIQYKIDLQVGNPNNFGVEFDEVLFTFDNQTLRSPDAVVETRVFATSEGIVISYTYAVSAETPDPPHREKEVHRLGGNMATVFSGITLGNVLPSRPGSHTRMTASLLYQGVPVSLPLTALMPPMERLIPYNNSPAREGSMHLHFF
jgi:hypothetical protein